jgi:hypothetical protein
MDPEDVKRLNLGLEWWQQASERDLEAIADLIADVCRGEDPRVEE